ncbi:alpha/beta fold hydrolase [Microbacterium sp. W4I20]|uniref:alpha/beta fold hydrolase n=1 Tax=Microbacterium sp. W4I20 TaxID=3042262 RepID=UPI002783F85F|nr:alpha/beta fold hydrolase [Microbacterium sp. W4I20]MDQ0728220.1 alpha-beta hydrolase superfamily lysophospholipase [Microbacterium sp. W4I20]
MTDTREFIDAHGIAIVYDVHPATATPRGVVQLLHGVGEHAGRYGALIAALTAAGFTVYADDHRGHGRTGIRQHDGPAGLGRLGKGGLRAAEDAIWQLTGIIRDENPDLPLVLFGHSWGSFLAQKLVNHHPEAWDAVILSGSALLTPTTLNAAPLNARWAKAEGATGLEWLSRDSAVWSAFGDDPLTTDVPLLKLFGPIEAAKLYGRPAKDLAAKVGHDIPMLLLVGRDDPVGGPRSVHKLADEYRTRSGLTDVTTLVYPDARHEIFNELQQDEVRADLLAWLDRRIATRDEG